MFRRSRATSSPRWRSSLPPATVCGDGERAGQPTTPVGARPLLAQAKRGDAILASKPQLALRHPELMPVDTALAPDRIARLYHALIGLAGQHLEATAPAFALDRQTLRHRRAFRQYTVKARVMPACRESDWSMVKRIAIDEAGQRREGQIGAIDRMGE